MGLAKVIVSLRCSKKTAADGSGDRSQSLSVGGVADQALLAHKKR
jgi:hypothetical protein